VYKVILIDRPLRIHIHNHSPLQVVESVRSKTDKNSEVCGGIKNDGPVRRPSFSLSLRSTFSWSHTSDSCGTRNSSSRSAIKFPLSSKFHFPPISLSSELGCSRRKNSKIIFVDEIGQTGYVIRGNLPPVNHKIYRHLIFLTLNCFRTYFFKTNILTLKLFKININIIKY